MANNEITLNPNKSTCIIQVAAGLDEQGAQQRVDVIIDELNKVLSKKLPADGVKFKVENRIVYSYYYDPIWNEMHERHKQEKAEVENYLQDIDKPELINGVRRIPARQIMTYRISVQI